MSFGQLLWALASLALAYGANQQLRPTFTRSYDAAQLTQVTGKVTVQLGGKPTEIPIVNMHIVTIDVTHVGKRYPVRELSIRPADGRTVAPSIQLFVSLPEDDGVDYALGVHDPRRLQGLTLAVKPSGRFGALTSYLTSEAERQDRVTGGKLTVTRIAPFGDDPLHYGYSIEGRLDLELETPTGARVLSGALAGRVIWDEG